MRNTPIPKSYLGQQAQASETLESMMERSSFLENLLKERRQQVAREAEAATIALMIENEVMFHFVFCFPFFLEDC